MVRLEALQPQPALAPRTASLVEPFSMQHVLHEHTNQSSDAGVVENRLGGAGAEDAGGLQEDSGVHRGGEEAEELGGSRGRPDGAASK